MTNIYTKYQISKTLNGKDIVYLARIGKQKKLVMRAGSEEQLVKLMEAESKKIDQKATELRKAQAEKVTQELLKSPKKKIGLWKPGKLVSSENNPDASNSDASANLTQSQSESN